ncbi:MAG: hypothetical protein MUO28_10555 [Desulfobacterales bacterium]|nr:hypothetical protein [Desulfobacterales bacterium]
MKKIAFILLLLLIPSMSGAVSPEAVQSMSAKLEAWDVEEAWLEMKDHLQKEPRNPQLLELASHIAFHRGEYLEAQKLIRAAIETGGDEEKRKGFSLFIEQTIGVITPFKKYETPHFSILLEEKQDGFLVDYFREALENTYQIMAKHYGFQPKEKIRVEVAEPKD